MRNRDQSCTNAQFSPRVVQFKFSPSGGLWRHLHIISSYQELQYGRVETLNIKIRLLFQNLLSFLMEARKWEKSEERRRNGTEEERNLIHIEEDCTVIYYHTEGIPYCIVPLYTIILRILHNVLYSNILSYSDYYIIC